MADHLLNDTEYKDLDYYGLGILTFDDLLKVDASAIEIHHKNEPPEEMYVKDNSLNNLQGLPYAFHYLFTNGERYKDPEKRKAYFIEHEEDIQGYAMSNELLCFEVANDHIYISSLKKFSNVDDIAWDTPLTPMDEADKTISRTIDMAINQEKASDYLDMPKRIVICSRLEDMGIPDKCRQWDIVKVKRGVKLTQLPASTPVSRNSDIIYNTTTQSVSFISRM